ncbi:MAG: hypothetical protein IT285_15285 [Bdellovibrionales bacterium]|nr:hypothetical protein [Bdellovibrionales bacterium]
MKRKRLSRVKAPSRRKSRKSVRATPNLNPRSRAFETLRLIAFDTVAGLARVARRLELVAADVGDVAVPDALRTLGPGRDAPILLASLERLSATHCFVKTPRCSECPARAACPTGVSAQ